MRRSLGVLLLLAAAGCGSEPVARVERPEIRDSMAEWSTEVARRRSLVAEAPPAAEPRKGTLAMGMTEEAVKELLQGALVEPGQRTVGEFVKDTYEVKHADTVTSVIFRNGALIGWTGPAIVGPAESIGALPKEQAVTITLPAAAPPAADVATPMPYYKGD